MTLLTVCQDAADLLTIPRPSAVYGSTDPQVTQLRGLLKLVGQDLLDAHDWSALITAATFTCGASNAQTGYPPAAFDRMADGVDMWNDTNNWPIHGPTSPQEWTELITRSVSTLPQYWRLIDGVFNIYAPSSGDTIRYEYISKYWILQAGSTPAATLSDDSDTFEFRDRNLIDGLVWRWKQAKGLDYAEDLETYNRNLSAAILKDKGGRTTLSTQRREDVRPRRTWPGTVTAV